jgi:hypothetical protein
MQKEKIQIMKLSKDLQDDLVSIEFCKIEF